MRILSVVNTPIRSLNFGTTKRTVYKTNSQDVFVRPFYDKAKKFLGYQDAQIVVSNSTRFFREDLPWNILAPALDEMFPNGKVNTYNFACSDGSEPYSLAIALIEQLGEEKAKRFFPIMASDIDSSILPQAQNYEILATKKDMSLIKNMTGSKTVSKYFTIKEKNKDGYILEPKDILKENVQFSKKSFEDGLDEVKKSNSLVLCRNFWAYMDKETILNCAKKLHKNLDNSSKIVIGKFDMDNGVAPLFLLEMGMNYVSGLHMYELILENHPDDKENYEHEEYIGEYIEEYCTDKR